MDRIPLNVGKRKPGVPSREEMYQILKDRSKEIQEKMEKDDDSERD